MGTAPIGEEAVMPLLGEVMIVGDLQVLMEGGRGVAQTMAMAEKERAQITAKGQMLNPSPRPEAALLMLVVAVKAPLVMGDTPGTHTILRCSTYTHFK